jgi:hypothetical protein
LCRVEDLLISPEVDLSIGPFFRAIHSHAWIAGLANPRLGELLEFATAVSTTDGVAPSSSQHRLEDHFRGIAG